MTYEELKAAQMEKNGGSKEEYKKSNSFMDAIKDHLTEEMIEKLKEGAKDGLIYAIGYSIGKATGNKLIKTITKIAGRDGEQNGLC